MPDRSADPGDLYGLPLEQFVPERGALARSLRGQGRRDEAADVAQLRKPSVAAWAVNQLVRTQGRAIAELFEAGDALRRAQDALLAGRGNAAELRTAGERERTAAAGLVSTARGLLGSEGQELSAAVLDRVADTLHAAAFDDEARAQVRGGRLVRELRHVGLGGGGLGGGSLGGGGGDVVATSGTTAPPPPRKGSAAKPEPAAERRRREQERAAAKAAQKMAREAESDARRRAERAFRAAEVAEQRRDRAAAALAESEARLAAAREQVDATAAAHRQAREALERLD